MAVIDIDTLTFGYEGTGDYVFENFSVRLDTGWRLGLVGRNGRGKTTLLKLLAGRLPYRGRIAADCRFVSFPFDVPDGAPVEDVGACVGGEEWRFLHELDLLGASGLLGRTFDTLSPGERTRVMLAALFAAEDGFPLIDEPTNHLDADGRRAAAAYLRKKAGFILVSHDRAFLDQCVDHILALNPTGAEIVRGDFSAWYANKTARDQFEAARNERLEGEIERLETAARRTADWSDRVEATKYGARNSGLRVDRGYVGRKAAKMMKRATAVENRRQKAVEEKSALLHDVEFTTPIKLMPLEYRAPVLVFARDVYALYEGRPSGVPATFELKRGERLRLVGGNGSGKSSLVKLVAGVLDEHAGELRIGSGLKISYVPQVAAGLCGTVAELAEARGIEPALAVGMLYRLGVERAALSNRAETFSEGQKKKVLLALSLCERADLYVWDEPLNYLDVIARMQIEEAVQTYRPAMLFVEHDEAAAARLATTQLEL